MKKAHLYINNNNISLNCSKKLSRIYNEVLINPHNSAFKMEEKTQLQNLLKYF